MNQSLIEIRSYWIFGKIESFWICFTIHHFWFALLKISCLKFNFIIINYHLNSLYQRYEKISKNVQIKLFKNTEKSHVHIVFLNNT